MTAINMLLDNLTYALPIGELTSLAPHWREPELRLWLEELRKTYVAVRTIGIICILLYIGVLALGAYLTLHGARQTYKSFRPASVGKFEVLGIKASWQGPAGVGIMIAGILVMVMSLQVHPLLKSLGICSGA